MNKAPHNYDIDIDFVKLIQILFIHKIKLFSFGLLGIFFGIIFSFFHQKIYLSEFKINIGHLMFNEKLLISSPQIQEMLNKGEVNSKDIPRLTFNNQTNRFKLITASKNFNEEITLLFNEALHKLIIDIKKIAESSKEDCLGYSSQSANKDDSALFFSSWTGQNIDNLNPDDVTQTLKITFSKTNTLYPNPYKHGLIGLFYGLLLAISWMIFITMFSKLFIRHR